MDHPTRAASSTAKAEWHAQEAITRLKETPAIGRDGAYTDAAARRGQLNAALGHVSAALELIIETTWRPVL